jgi:hypothetical protein
MQQARRRVLGAAGEALAMSAAGDSLGGNVPLTAQHLRLAHTEAGNRFGLRQLCSLVGWDPSAAAHGGAAGRAADSPRSCSSQQPQPAGWSQWPGHRQTGDQSHADEDADRHPISSGPLQGSIPVAALLAISTPAEAAAADGFGPVVAAMQLIDGLHVATGLPWWATLSLTAVGESQNVIPLEFFIMSR